jgi:adenylate kinase family enzyme
MKEKYLWVEEYRPKTISECILTPELKETFETFVQNGEVPNLLLTGGPGVGKTTVAKALCNELGMDHMLINGSEDGNIDTLRTKIRQYASTVSFSGNGKVVILDEADYLNPQSTQEKENVQFKPKPVVELITRHFPDWRRVLNELQRYSMSGQIDEGILVNLGDVSINALVTSLKERKFNDMRQWVAQNLDNDQNVIFRTIYDGLFDSVSPNSIPQAVVTLAEYQYKSAFVADQEVNMVACLTELMVNCEWK